jgi:hypothetical protein
LKAKQLRGNRQIILSINSEEIVHTKEEGDNFGESLAKEKRIS